jgi:hypothetical protein
VDITRKQYERPITYDGKTLYLIGNEFYRLTKDATAIPLMAKKTGIPYIVDIKTKGLEYRIEEIEVFDYESPVRGGKHMALIINNVYYRPSCE